MEAPVKFPDFQKYEKVKRAYFLEEVAPVDFPQQGKSYPASLALLWPLKLSDAGVLKSAKGPSPTFTATPTVTSSGVTPGDGPVFTSAVTWVSGGTLVVKFTATVASASITVDTPIFGGFVACVGGVKFSDGTNTTPVYSTTWSVGDVVTLCVQVSSTGKLRIGRIV